MTKKVAISYQEIFENIKFYFSDKDIEFILCDAETLKTNYKNYDLAVLYDEYDFSLDKNNIINVHPSLLPAFSGENAITNTFNSEVKVSGVTIHCKDKILAQYPILIGLETHIDDFIKEIHAIAQKLIPLVIDAKLNNRIFDFKDLFNNSCNKNTCTKCNGCH